MDDRVILGINCAHDAAACIAVDGVVLCAVEEERLNRSRHAFGFPSRSIDYCIAEAQRRHGVSIPDVVVINQNPPADFECRVSALFPQIAPSNIIVNPSHHLLHACYAMMCAKERPLVVLIVDGSGYMYAEYKARNSPLLGEEPPRHDAWEALSAYYVDANGDVSLLIKDWAEWASTMSPRFPSLGHMFSLAATHIFGGWMHAGKVMGLAPFGTADGFQAGPIVTMTDQSVRVDTRWIMDVPAIAFSERIEENRLARDMAAKVQAELEAAMRHLAAVLHAKTHCASLALSGGVALNSVVNGRLVREGPFANVVITPAAHDAGTAIGAAAYGYKTRTKKTLAFEADEGFLGRSYDEREITSALDRYPDLAVERVPDPAAAAAADLAAGRIVGWFEGRSEFGPRALGHRSIFADPRDPTIKDILNARIKFRESFRPYAAAVLREHSDQWFVGDADSPHMLVVSEVRPERAGLIPAVVHVDRTCRLQTVGRGYPGALRRILEAFYERTKVPLILNTSLNVCGEPISETPRDALECVTRSGLNILYCGGYRIEKRLHVRACNGEADVTVAPVRPFRLVTQYANTGDRIELSQSWVEQGARRVNVSESEAGLLLSRFGTPATPDDTSRKVDMNDVQVRRCVEALCDRGVLYVTTRGGLVP